MKGFAIGNNDNFIKTDVFYGLNGVSTTSAGSSMGNINTTPPKVINRKPLTTPISIIRSGTTEIATTTKAISKAMNNLKPAISVSPIRGDEQMGGGLPNTPVVVVAPTPILYPPVSDFPPPPNNNGAPSGGGGGGMPEPQSQQEEQAQESPKMAIGKIILGVTIASGILYIIFKKKKT